MRGTILSRGIRLETLDHYDLLDIAWALIQEPLAGDPKAREKFREEVCKPLPGSAKAKKKLTTDILGTMGVAGSQAAKMLARSQEAAAKKAEPDAPDPDNGDTASP